MTSPTAPTTATRHDRPAKGEACPHCAPLVPGKTWALASRVSHNAWHYCANGRPATTCVLSWHVSREAAHRARLAHRRIHKGCMVMVSPLAPGARERIAALRPMAAK